MAWTIKEIGCILMASGLSERYGRNKLLEPMDGREIILHTAGNLQAAGFTLLAVTRSEEIRELMAREGIACVLHDRPKKSDTIRIGLENLAPGRAGYLFMPGDQPLVRPASLPATSSRLKRKRNSGTRIRRKAWKRSGRPISAGNGRNHGRH